MHIVFFCAHNLLLHIGMNVCCNVLYTVKKVSDFPVPSRDVSLVSDIPAGDGKTANLFLQCTQTSFAYGFS
jgi:hypothetical protein